MNQDINKDQLAVMMKALKPKDNLSNTTATTIIETPEDLEVHEPESAKYPVAAKTDINPEFVRSIKDEFKSRKAFDPLTTDEILFSMLLQLRRIAGLMEQQRNISLGIVPGEKNGEG